MKPLSSYTNMEAIIDYKPLRSYLDMETVFQSPPTQVQLISPNDGASNIDPNVLHQWENFPDADFYHVRVFEDSGGEIGAEVINRIVNAVELQQLMSENTTHHWNVTVSNRQEPVPPPEITGTSITPSTATVTEGESLILNGNVQGTGDYDTSGTWTRESGNAIPFTVDANEITISPVTAGDSAVFRFTASNGMFTERTITAIEASTQVDTREGDELFLAEWYASTNGANWFNNDGWNNGNPSLDTPMTGVTVQEINGELRVTEIDMQFVTFLASGCPNGNNCVGTIPDSLGNLKKCWYFNIKTNKITGVIPQTIGYMMDLEWCSLGGQRKLIDLALHQWNENNHACTASKAWEETNAIQGEIPPSLFLLPKLRMFECRRQWLTGALPQTIWYAEELVGLFLNDSKGTNPLGGGQSLPTKPVDANGLQKLVHFHIDTRSNETIVGTWNTAPNTQVGFVGQIPPEWENLPQLRHVRFRDQNFTGNTPVFVSQDLRVVRIGAGFDSGGFPVGYFQKPSPSMTMFRIGTRGLGAGLELPPPEVITHPVNSDDVGLNGCGFIGPIYDWLVSGNRLQIFDASGNSFTDGFPEPILDAPNFKTLYLNGNPLGGPLPNKEIASRRWNAIFMSNCGFIGGIPPLWEVGMTESVQMNYFYIDNNLLEDLIPAWFAQLWRDASKTTPIRRIRLHNNKFTPKDILPHRDAIASHVTEEYIYLPQKPFGSAQSLPSGSTIDLSAFTYPNQTYEWRRNGAPIGGETGLTINTSLYGDGEYVLFITHPDLAFTFQSEIQLIG